jgi:large subunit ribosomal protein L10
MGKQPLAKKAEIVDKVRSLLQASQMVLVIDYKGLTVAEMDQLRAELRKSDSVCMVVKNTLMRRAIADQKAWAGIIPFLAGPTAFILIRGDISAALKAYQDFAKQTKKTEFRGAGIEGLSLTLEQAKAIAELPPKEVLMAQVAGSLKSVGTGLAVGLNAVPTQVARGIHEIPASLGRAIRAIADKEAA